MCETKGVSLNLAATSEGLKIVPWTWQDRSLIPVTVTATPVTRHDCQCVSCPWTGATESHHKHRQITDCGSLRTKRWDLLTPAAEQKTDERMWGTSNCSCPRQTQTECVKSWWVGKTADSGFVKLAADDCSAHRQLPGNIHTLKMKRTAYQLFYWQGFRPWIVLTVKICHVKTWGDRVNTLSLTHTHTLSFKVALIQGKVKSEWLESCLMSWPAQGLVSAPKMEWSVSWESVCECVW